MADVEQKYQLMRFDFTNVQNPLTDSGVTQLLVGVLPARSRRLTESEAAAVTIPEFFTREEIVNSLRSLADRLEKQLT